MQNSSKFILCSIYSASLHLVLQLIGEDQPPMYETPSSPTTVFSVQTPSLGSSLEYAEETMSRPFGGPPPWSSNDLSRSETSTASPSAQQTPGTSRRTEKLPASDQAPGTSRRAEKLPAFDRAMGQSPSPSFIDICKKEKKPGMCLYCLYQIRLSFRRHSNQGVPWLFSRTRGLVFCLER